MKKNKINSLLIASLLLLFSACDIVDLAEPDAVVDSKGNVVTGVTRADIMTNDSTNFRTLITDSTSKTWNTALFTLAGTSQFTDCRLDDVMMFFPNGTYQYSAGSKLCGAEDTQRSRGGVWEINFTTKEIIFDKGTSNEYTAEVIGLNEDELRLEGTYMGMEIRGLYTKS